MLETRHCVCKGKNEMRQKVLSTLQGYLESPTYLEDLENDVENRGELEYASKHQITNLAHELLLRLKLYTVFGLNPHRVHPQFITLKVF